MPRGLEPEPTPFDEEPLPIPADKRDWRRRRGTEWICYSTKNSPEWTLAEEIECESSPYGRTDIWTWLAAASRNLPILVGRDGTKHNSLIEAGPVVASEAVAVAGETFPAIR